MDTLSRWLGAPRGVLILFGTVVALPAATLVFLGVRLHQQDGELAHQRQAEVLEQASGRAVRALDVELAVIQRRLSEPAWRPAEAPPGAVYLLIAKDEARAVPSSALAYYPIAPTLKEPAAAPFGELETIEFKTQDLPKALELSARLAASTDPLVRAGALLRQARILRKMGRPADALSIYGTLATLTTISINGTPADLLARRMRCQLLAELRRTNEHRQEAAALDMDLVAGRWPLDRMGYDYVSAQLDTWLGSARRPHVNREHLAAAVEWLYGQWTGTTAGGVSPTGARCPQQLPFPIATSRQPLTLPTGSSLRRRSG